MTLYMKLKENTVLFPEVRINFTSNQMLESSAQDKAQALFNSQPIGRDMNFIMNEDKNATNEVCSQKIGKLSPDSTFISSYNCPWEYKCDYDPRRIPQVIWQADCDNKYNTWPCSCSNDLVGPCNDCIPVEKFCVPVYYPVPVLYTSNCSPYDTHGTWKWTQLKVAVSCACNNENAYT